MPALIRATVVMPWDVGGNRNESRNVWHFSAIDDGAANLNGIADGLVAFYNAVPAVWASTISTAGSACRIEMATVTPGGAGEEDDTVSSLKATRLWTKQTALDSDTDLPPQIAAAFSFSASAAAVPEEDGLIRPRSRRRGRVFLGPLNASQLEATAPVNLARISSNMQESFLDAYDTAHAIWDDLNAFQVVYSRAGATQLAVDRIWMDNAWDVLRSRNVAATQRTARAITPAAAQTGRSGAVEAILPR